MSQEFVLTRAQLCSCLSQSSCGTSLASVSSAEDDGSAIVSAKANSTTGDDAATTGNSPPSHLRYQDRAATE